MEDLRNILPPPISARQQAVSRIGAEVRALKEEVVFLRDALKSAENYSESLKKRLDYYEQREEDELVRQSLDYEKQKDANNRYQKYAKFTNRNFSPNFKR